MLAEQPIPAGNLARPSSHGCTAHGCTATQLAFSGDDLQRLDPRLVTLCVGAREKLHGNTFARVFVRTSAFPFAVTEGRLVPAIAGLEPGFVTDAAGAIFSRATPPAETPPGGGAEARPPYLFTATVRLCEPEAGAISEAATDGARGGAEAGPIPLERLARAPGVDWVQAAPRMRPQLDWSLSEIGARPRQALRERPPQDGRDVVVGVVDFGCDFAHPNFLDDQGGTRLLALWDQNPLALGDQTPRAPEPPRPAPPGSAEGGAAEGGARTPAEVPRGRVFTRKDIDRALRAARRGAACPYAALGYDPHANYYTPGKAVPEGEGAHGTHVLDIAAGNGRGTGLRGVAPGASLVFVQLPRFDWTQAGDLAQGAWVYEAAAYVFACAEAHGLPAVVNLSLTTNTGTHDGTNQVEAALEALLRKPGRAVVVCAGNERLTRTHAGGTPAPGAARSLRWRFPQKDDVPNQLLLCHDGGPSLDVRLRDRDGCVVFSTRDGATATGSHVLRRHGEPVGVLSFGHDAPGPRSGHNRPNRPPSQVEIVLRSDPDDADEVWTLDLRAGEAPIEFDAWIERDDPDQSRFDGEDASPAVTLGSLACGESCIVVGAYNPLAPLRRPAAPFSSEGPTRDGRQKPDLIAPGVGIYAARSKRGGAGRCAPRRRLSPQAGMVLSGTSQGAPHVSGVVALLFQKAAALGRRPDCDELRKLLRDTSRRDALTPVPDGWHPRAGCGRLDAQAALEALA